MTRLERKVRSLTQATETVSRRPRADKARPFEGDGLFQCGGTLSADNSLPVPSRGASYGTWKQEVGTPTPVVVNAEVVLQPICGSETAVKIY